MAEVSSGAMPGWSPAFPGASVGKGLCQMANLQAELVLGVPRRKRGQNLLQDGQSLEIRCTDCAGQERLPS